MKIKKERIIEISILLFLVVASVLTAHTIYYNKMVKPNLYTIEFHDIDSIIKGSPVRLMGIIVGHVRNLTRDNDKILCQIVVTKPNTRIPDGAVAKVEYNGLGGSKSIEIMPPKTNDPDIKGIIGTDALRISDFADAFNDVREVLACIRQFVAVLTPENTLGAVKAISDMPDFTENTDIALDKALNEEKKIQKQIKNLKKLELELDKAINFTKHK